MFLFSMLAIAQPQAQQPSQAQIAAIRSSCRSDFLADCSGVRPGGKDALMCLQHNLAKLSPPCKTAVSAITPAPAPAHPATAAVPRPAQPAVTASPPPAVVAPAPAPAPAATHEAKAPEAKIPEAKTPEPEPPAASHAVGGSRHIPAAQTDGIRESCRSDFRAHCPAISPGSTEALKCLRQNLARLSSNCRAAVAATRRAPAVAARTVNAPAPPPAPAVAPLTLRPFILPQRRIVILTICGRDARRLCAGTPPGRERILKCLAARASQVSPSCYAALSRVSRK